MAAVSTEQLLIIIGDLTVANRLLMNQVAELQQRLNANGNAPLDERTSTPRD